MVIGLKLYQWDHGNWSQMVSSSCIPLEQTVTPLLADNLMPEHMKCDVFVCVRVYIPPQHWVPARPVKWLEEALPDSCSLENSLGGHILLAQPET